MTGSPERLRQAIANIVDNAVSVSPPQGRVTMTAEECNGRVIVRVDDEGPGIPPEHLDRIFDRFFSFRSIPADHTTHDGLGLAIARAIVEGYGGVIRASNRESHGARFEIELPGAKNTQ